MSLLFIDFESSDKIRRDRPLDDPSQPWIVSAAADLMTQDGESLSHFSFRIQAEGRAIRPGAEAVHGISTRAAGSIGVSDTLLLATIIGFAKQARRVFSFGMDFDRDLVTSLILRKGKDPRAWTRPGLEFVDLIRASAPFCRLPSEHESQGWRWPNLDEACETLLKEPRRVGHHGAWPDCQRAYSLFVWLDQHGAFKGETA